MQYLKDELDHEIFKINNDQENRDYIKLYTRLDKAITKTGSRALLCDNPQGIELEAIKLLAMIKFSIMRYSQDTLEYKSGHKYGEKLDVS